MARRSGVVLQASHAAQAEITPLFSKHDRVVMRCGRRWGKTTLLENCAATWAYDGEKVGWFAPSFKLILPSYKRILGITRPIVTSKSKIDMLIETKVGGKTGSVEFWTLSDEDAGRSRSYDRIIIDEGSLVSKGLRDTWERAMAPTLLDRRGKAVMAGTPKGIDPENFFYEACNSKDLGWHEVHAPTRDNPMLDPVGVANLVNEYPPLVYQQEFLAEWVSWQGSAFFSLDKLLIDDAPVDPYSRCDFVFAIIDSAVKTGSANDGTAVSYFAQNEFTPVKLQILDWDIQQIEGSLLEAWLPSVFERLEQLAAQCGARRGSIGVWVEDKASGMILNQQAARRGWPVEAIDSKLTALGKDERAVSVSGYHYQGLCKITADAYHKTVNYKGQTRNHFISQVCGFRIGVKDQSDDLLDTYSYGLAAAFGNGNWF